ncbi:MAG: hypothetical protein AAF616_05450 [Bacteroidota bacterium]
MTATDLRKNLFKILDQIEKTGESVRVKRKGSEFILRPSYQKGSKLKNLRREGIVNGESDELVDFKVWDVEASWDRADFLDGGN